MSVLGSHHLAYRVAVHRNCVHNQYASLSLRHIVDRTYIAFNHREFKTTKQYLLTLYNSIDNNLHPYPLNTLPKYYSGSKRKVYERALEDIYIQGFDRKWANVSMFVKPDKIPLAEVGTKAPRAIQYRRPHFNLLMARFLRPIEHAVYQYEEHGHRVFAKGRNLQERAADILAIHSRFKDPVVIECDHSKFDSCVRVEHLKLCHWFYKKFFKSRTLHKLLRCQIHNKGRTAGGLRYRVTGTRMSGDFDTALGNSLINYVVLKYYTRTTDASLYIDGDDSLIFVERTALSKLQFADFEKMGFETKIKFTSLIEAEFCQAHVIRSDPPILVRNPLRVISHMLVCLKKFGAKTWPQLLQGKFICEYMAHQGVPYMQEYFKSLITGDKFRIPDEDMIRWINVRQHLVGRPTDQAYADFYTAFQFGPELQILLNDPTGFVRTVKLGTCHVLESSSISLQGKGYESLHCSPSLRCRTGCPCTRAASRQCDTVVLRPKAHAPV
ncbi:MAG: RNA-dependent RNA polymerase [Sanya tombus-like virus 1]|nr:MAG: RNA-dependent RNA polymerase [Sanya tombus-like virus 1]